MWLAHPRSAACLVLKWHVCACTVQPECLALGGICKARRKKNGMCVRAKGLGTGSSLSTTPRNICSTCLHKPRTLVGLIAPSLGSTNRQDANRHADSQVFQRVLARHVVHFGLESFRRHNVMREFPVVCQQEKACCIHIQAPHTLDSSLWTCAYA